MTGKTVPIATGIFGLRESRLPVGEQDSTRFDLGLQINVMVPDVIRFIGKRAYNGVAQRQIQTANGYDRRSRIGHPGLNDGLDRIGDFQVGNDFPGAAFIIALAFFHPKSKPPGVARKS